MNDLKLGGRWIIEEVRNYINYLELLVCFFGFKLFCFVVMKKNIRLFMDNIIVILYINNMGGIILIKCDKFVKEIWFWCMKRELWLSVWYIFGKDNLIGDNLLRKFDD